MQYYLIDTETTGLVCGYNEVVEISIIRISDKVQLTRQIRALHPERASLDSLKIIGKSKYQLSEGISSLEAIEISNKFMNEDGLSPKQRCIIAHNAPFDRRFCHNMWETYNSIFPADYWVDTMAIMRKYNKTAGIKSKVNLQDSLDSLGIVKVAGLHNAKSDTQNTFKLWKKLTDELGVDYLEFIKNHAMGKTSDEDLQSLIHEEGSGEETSD